MPQSHATDQPWLHREEETQNTNSTVNEYDNGMLRSHSTDQSTAPWGSDTNGPWYQEANKSKATSTHSSKYKYESKMPQSRTVKIYTVNICGIKRGSYMVWEINMGVCPGLEFYNNMLLIVWGMTFIFMVHLSFYAIPLLIYDVMYDITTTP